MTPKVSKGLATWAGIVAALGQYMAAIAVFLADTDKATGLGPLVTATVTLLAVIYGRMSQAKAAIVARPAPVTLAALEPVPYTQIWDEGEVADLGDGTTPRVQPEPRGAAVLDFDEGDVRQENVATPREVAFSEDWDGPEGNTVGCQP